MFFHLPFLNGRAGPHYSRYPWKLLARCLETWGFMVQVGYLDSLGGSWISSQSSEANSQYLNVEDCSQSRQYQHSNAGHIS